MAERVYIRDRNGNIVNDPERSEVTGLRWASAWPGGFAPMAGRVARDIAASWAVKAAYEIIVRDGQKIVYQGRLQALDRQLHRGQSKILIFADGWGVILREKKIRKRWVDLAAISHLEWPQNLVNDDMQNSFPFFLRENYLEVLMGTKDIERDKYHRYWELYRLPGGAIRRVTFNWKIRTGEGIDVRIVNVDNGDFMEHQVTANDPAGVTGTVDHVLTGGDTSSIKLGIGAWLSYSDLYDQNDYAVVSNLAVYAKMDNFPSPSYTGGEIVQDVLYLAASELSGDYSAIAEPGVALIPFATLGDDYESAWSIISRVAGYGDTQGRTWGLCVWDEWGTSDNKPAVTFNYLDTSDYEYAVSLADLAEFRDDESDDYLFNWVVVRYIDERGIVRYLSPDDAPSLADQDSINRYGRRVSPTLDVGQATAALAQSFGERFLNYHKGLLSTIHLAARGTIRRKDGARVPVNRVRAGERVKVLDYAGGQVYFLQRVQYDASSQTMRAVSGLPVDPVGALVAQQRLEASRPRPVDVSSLGRWRRESALRRWEPRVH